jgi:hypothetical protein
MPARYRNGLLGFCAALITALPIHAETQTFADLLAQAKLQSATGHRWAPPGDNMTETVMHMMDIIGTATPAQLSELSGLLDGGLTVLPPPAPNVDLPNDELPTPAVPEPSASPALAGPPLVSPPLAGPPLASTPLAGPPLASPPLAGSPLASPPLASPPLAGSPLASTPLAGPPLASPPLAGPPPTVALAAPATPPALPDRPEPGSANPIVSSQAVPAPGSRAGVLFARGHDAELRGDLSGARRFYQSSANQGDATAARNLGRLYDPAYLKQNALGGVDPDPALARYWYERAVRFGDPEAGRLLEALSVR